MKQNFLIVVLACGFIIITILGYFVWGKFSQPAVINKEPVTKKTPLFEVKKIDLSTQPEWVQKLIVKVTKGTGQRGLASVTLNVSGMPKGLVASASYVIQYQTSNYGAQGALLSKPLDINGSEKFSKTIELGTCSTKSCVYHEGVTSIDVELDFTTTSGEQNIWTGTVQL